MTQEPDHPSMPRDGEIVTVVETEILEADGHTAEYEVRENSLFHNPTDRGDDDE